MINTKTQRLSEQKLTELNIYVMIQINKKKFVVSVKV